jgi:hypothetical protein
MNSYSILMANGLIQDLLDEAAVRRALTGPKPGLLKRIASAASAVNAAIVAPADYSKSILPPLNDYPYRS